MITANKKKTNLVGRWVKHLSSGIEGVCVQDNDQTLRIKLSPRTVETYTVFAREVVAVLDHAMKPEQRTLFAAIRRQLMLPEIVPPGSRD